MASRRNLRYADYNGNTDICKHEKNGTDIGRRLIYGTVFATTKESGKTAQTHLIN